MGLLRRRKLILCLLVLVWISGLYYFLMPLVGSEEHNTEKLISKHESPHVQDNDKVLNIHDT